MVTNNRLRELRIERRLTIRQLGEKTNIAYPTISRMENGTRPFTQTNLEILCDFFGVSIDYMLGKSDKRLMVIDEAGTKPLIPVKPTEDSTPDEITDYCMYLASKLIHAKNPEEIKAKIDEYMDFLLKKELDELKKGNKS